MLLQLLIALPAPPACFGRVVLLGYQFYIGLLADLPEALICGLERVHRHHDGQLLLLHELVPV